MNKVTTDKNHPDLKCGIDNVSVPQAKTYLVLSDEEISKGFLKPFRTSYKHLICGTQTIMDKNIAATYARDPYFYGGTYCVTCMKHRPLEEFTWEME